MDARSKELLRDKSNAKNYKPSSVLKVNQKGGTFNSEIGNKDKVGQDNKCTNVWLPHKHKLFLRNYMKEWQEDILLKILLQRKF